MFCMHVLVREKYEWKSKSSNWPQKCPSLILLPPTVYVTIGRSLSHHCWSSASFSPQFPARFGWVLLCVMEASHLEILVDSVSKQDIGHCFCLHLRACTKSHLFGFHRKGQPGTLTKSCIKTCKGRGWDRSYFARHVTSYSHTDTKVKKKKVLPLTDWFSNAFSIGGCHFLQF